MDSKAPQFEVYGAKLAAESAQLPLKYIFNVEDRFGEVSILEDGEFPVINLSGQHEQIVEAVSKACKEWGFFQVTNHRVPACVLEDIVHVAGEFFDLPLEKKQAINTLGSDYNGSDPYGAYKYGKYTKSKFVDWKDMLRMNYHIAKELDVWLENPSSFRKVVKEYNEQVSQLAEELTDIISEGLGLNISRSYLSEMCTAGQIMRFSYYPPCPTPELVKGVSAHTDVRIITILLQDEVGGLEVCKDGIWYSVKPLKNALVVNVGDMLHVMTNGKFKSAEHRVRVNSTTPRMSVITFLGAADDTVVAPLPELVTDDDPPKYKDCTSRQFLKNYRQAGVGLSTTLTSVKLT